MDTYLNQLSSDHPSHLKICHINAQSLCDTSHYSEFCSNFSNSGLDIIAVSETFYRSTSNKKLANYLDFSADRNHSTASGGVAIYVKDCYEAKFLASSEGVYGRPEFLLVEVLIKTVKILCVCIYRPPHVGYMEDFTSVLFEYIGNYKYCFVSGDVNARFGSGSAETQNVIDHFQLCNLTFIPFQPTFHSGQCNSSLDVIASNCHDLLIKSGQLDAPGFSHHDLLFAIFNLATPRVSGKKNVTYRDFKNLDVNSLLMEANTMNWEKIYKINNVDDKVSLLNSMMIELMDKYAPCKTVKVKNYDEPWITRDLKNGIKQRDKLWKVYRRSGKQEDFEAFRRIRNKVKQNNRNAKIRYFNETFSTSNNSKYIWSKVRSLGIGGRESNSIPVVNVNELVNHYANVSSVKFPEEVATCISEYCNQQGLCSDKDKEFHFKYVVPDEICEAVSSIKSQAKGVDLVPVVFIKACLPVILPVLEHLFNYSLQNSQYPSVWKQAQILPIPKTKQPKECKDYRPVSILCVLAKIFEKLVYSQTYNFVEQFDILSPLQSGFRRGCSTNTALLKVTNDIRKAMDDGKLTILSLLDLSKAFDCVHHPLLLAKLRLIGFSTSVIRWFQSYLEGRSIRVYINDDLVSNWLKVSTGVPQGSVLGPLLFLLYLFDLSKGLIFSSFHLYADDVELYIHFPLSLFSRATECMSHDINWLIKYFNSHNLALNVDKTQAMVLGSHKALSNMRKNSLPALIVNGQNIPYVTECKSLGVVLDCTLSWNHYCNLIVGKVFGILAQLRRNMSFIPTHIRKLLVQSLVFPHLDYALTLFTGLSQENLLQLQRAQNAALRFVSYIPRHHHVTPLFKDLAILKIKERILFKLAYLIWKIMKYRCPVYLFDLFHPLVISSGRGTRFGDKILKIPTHRTTVYNNSFVVQVCRIYNDFKLHELLNKSEFVVRKFLLNKLLCY